MYLAIAFHNDVLKGLFDTAVVVVAAVVVGARSRLAFFRNPVPGVTPRTFFIIFFFKVF